MAKSNHSEFRISPIFLVSLVLLAAVLVPILQADRFISDDWRRAVSGESGWNSDGRPLTELTMRVADLGTPMLDISPLPQLGALVCYASITVLLARKFRIASPVVAALIFLPLAANPLTLRNIAHKFDSLPIALSILLAILPITFSGLEGWRGRAWGCILLVGSLSFYQPSLNFYLAFALLELLLLQQESVPVRELFRTCLVRIAQLVAALIIYRIVAALTVRGNYAVPASQLALSLKELPSIIDKELSVWSFIWHKFPSLFRLVFSTILGLGLLLTAWTEIRYFGRVRLNLTMPALAGLIALLILIPITWLLSAVGPLVLLRQFGPSLTRVDGGFGALLSSALILITWRLNSLGIRHSWQVVVLSIPGLMLISFAAIYANAEKEQRIYETQIGARLSADLRRMAIEQPFSSVSFAGDVGFAPLTARAEKRFPVIKYLVEIDLKAGFAFTSNVFSYYRLPNPQLNSPCGDSPCESPPLLIDQNYTVIRCGDRLMVELTAD